MQSLWRKFQLVDPNQSLSLRRQRELLLNAILISSTILGTLLYALSYFPVFEKGLSTAIPGFYTSVYLGLLAITFVRRIPYGVRVGGCLFLFYALGVFNLIMNGFNVDAGLFLLTFIAMSSLFLDFKGGLVAILLSGVTGATIGYFVTHAGIQLRMGLPQTDPLLWLIGGNIYLMMGVMLTITINALLRSLDLNLSKSIEMGEELKKAMQALESSEERFRSLIEYSTDIISVLDREGIIRYVSPSVKRILGYKTDELIGRSVFELIHSDDHELVIAALSPEVPAEMIGPTIEAYVLHKDGSWRVIEVRGREMYNNPSIMGAVINCRDITERKEAEQLLQKAKDELERRVAERTAELQITTGQLMELITHSPSVIYSAQLSRSFGIMTITQNVAAMTGFEPSEFTAKADFWISHVHPEDVEAVCTERQRLCTRERTTCEYRFMNQTGEYRWIRDVMAPMISPDGSVSRLVGSWSDITEQKKTEEARQASRSL